MSVISARFLTGGQHWLAPAPAPKPAPYGEPEPKSGDAEVRQVVTFYSENVLSHPVGADLGPGLKEVAYRSKPAGRRPSA